MKTEMITFGVVSLVLTGILSIYVQFANPSPDLLRTTKNFRDISISVSIGWFLSYGFLFIIDENDD
jgi:hypothetical protein